MPTAHINIGSNLGRRDANISDAVAGIRRIARCRVEAVSTPVESEPQGFDSEHSFVNVGVRLYTELAPLELLHALLQTERAISPASHRTAAGGYADRMIDIDLIAYDDVVADTPELTLPHPRMHERAFVLTPLAELAPTWRHPLLGLTATQMLEALQNNKTE